MHTIWYKGRRWIVDEDNKEIVLLAESFDSIKFSELPQKVHDKLMVLGVL